MEAGGQQIKKHRTEDKKMRKSENSETAPKESDGHVLVKLLKELESAGLIRLKKANGERIEPSRA
jgi:hypothetical protein